MQGCGVAFLDTEKDTHAAECSPMARGQAEALLPMAQGVLAQVGISFSALDAIVTTVGPGAFTGLRMGLSTARALGLALSCPVIGVTTLEVLAASFFDKNTLNGAACLCVAIETKRSDFYVQFFDSKEQPLSDPAALAAEDMRAFISDVEGGVILIGDGAARFLSMVEDATAVTFIEGYDLPHPLVMARLGGERLSAADVEQYRPTPLYLRGADVSQPKRKQRKIKSA